MALTNITKDALKNNDIVTGTLYGWDVDVESKRTGYTVTIQVHVEEDSDKTVVLKKFFANGKDINKLKRRIRDEFKMAQHTGDTIALMANRHDFGSIQYGELLQLEGVEYKPSAEQTKKAEEALAKTMADE